MYVRAQLPSLEEQHFVRSRVDQTSVVGHGAQPTAGVRHVRQGLNGLRMYIVARSEDPVAERRQQFTRRILAVVHFNWRDLGQVVERVLKRPVLVFVKRRYRAVEKKALLEVCELRGRAGMASATM